MLTPHEPQRRAVIEAMIRANDLSLVEIAARTGIPVRTVQSWKRHIVLRKETGKRRDPPCPEAWTVRRRAAVARLLAKPEIDPGDVAQALGAPRAAAPDLLRAFGLARRRRAADVPDLGDLDAALRAHLGRQIAALDARLKAGGAATESGKILRDLAGLKRLLDDLTGGARRTRDGDADEAPEEDLAVLRERIARRVAAFAGDWSPGPVSGQRADVASEDARP